MPGAQVSNGCTTSRLLLLLLQELSVPLTRFLKLFPALSSLHPFEAALLDLTVGTATYSSVLQKVDTLRKAIQEVSIYQQWRACVLELSLLRTG